MRKIINVVSFLIFVYLFTSPLFTSSIVFGQELITSCKAVQVEEADKWPNVVYCSQPLTEDVGDNTVYNYFVYVNKPKNSDVWTDHDFYLDSDGVINGDSFSIELLNPEYIDPVTGESVDYPVAEWSTDKQRLKIMRSGSFIIYGFSSPDIEFTPSDNYIRINGVEDCSKLLFTATIMNQYEANEYDESLSISSTPTALTSGISDIIYSQIILNKGLEIPNWVKNQVLSVVQGDWFEHSWAMVRDQDNIILEFIELPGIHEQDSFSATIDTFNFLTTLKSQYPNTRITLFHNHRGLGTDITRFESENIPRYLLATPSFAIENGEVKGDYATFFDEQVQSAIGDVVTPEVGIIGHFIDEPDVLYFETWKMNWKPNEFPILERSYKIQGYWDPRAKIKYGLIERTHPSSTNEYHFEVASTPIDPDVFDLVSYDEVVFLEDQTRNLNWNVGRVFTDAYHGYISEVQAREHFNYFYDDWLTALYNQVDASSLPFETRTEFYSILDSMGSKITNIQDYGFKKDNLDLVKTLKNLNYDIEIGLTKTNAKSFKRGIELLTRLEQDYGYKPSEGALEELIQQRAKHLSDIQTQKSEYLHSKYLERAGDFLKRYYTYPDELYIPMEIGEPTILSIFAGFIPGFLIGFGGGLALWGEHYQDYYTAEMGMAILNQGLSVGLYVLEAVVGTLVLSYIIGGLATATLFFSYLLSFMFWTLVFCVVGIIVGLITALVYVFFFTFPEHFPCEKDEPWYDDDHIRVEKNIVHLGDTLHYIYYGVRYCYPPDLYTAVPFYADRQDPFEQTINLPIGEGAYGGGGWTDIYCHTLDGRCFYCNVTVTEPEPGQWYFDAISWDTSTSGVWAFPDYIGSEPLLVCPTDAGLDESENKCVICDTTTHTEIRSCGDVGGECKDRQVCNLATGKNCIVGQYDCPDYYCCCVPDGAVIPGKCEQGCGADPACDEIIPETNNCDANCNYVTTSTTTTIPPETGCCEWWVPPPSNCMMNTQFQCQIIGEDVGGSNWYGSSYGCINDNCEPSGTTTTTSTTIPIGGCTGTNLVSCFAPTTLECNALGPCCTWHSVEHCKKRSCSGMSQATCEACAGCTWVSTTSSTIPTSTITTTTTSTTSASTTTTIPSECPGDITGDEIVDIFDALILSGAFGSSPGNSNWNSNADIIKDEVIDIFDALMLSSVFGKACEEIQTNTVAVYNLDEGSGNTIHDSSGYDNDGTISNPEWVSGRSGYALHFTQENQYIIIPHDESLNPRTSDFTVEAWIKGTDPWIEISKLMYGHGYSLVVVSVGSTAYIQFSIAGETGVAGPMYTFPLSDLNDGNWHHVVGVKEDDTVKVYLDDVLRSSEYAPGLGDVSSDTNLIIGSSYEADVTIDEVKIKKTV